MRNISLVLSVLIAQSAAAQCDSANLSTISAGETCTISSSATVKEGKLTNNGTLILQGSPTLTFGGKEPPPDPELKSIDGIGLIQVRSWATLDATGKTFKITGQKIHIQDGQTLVIKSKELTLGEQNKTTTIYADHRGTLTLDGTSTLTFGDAGLKNLDVSAKELTTIAVQKLSLDNTKINASQDITWNGNGDIQGVSAESGANYTLKNQSVVSGKAIKISGSHTAGGGGSLIFSGSSIDVGTTTAELRLGTSGATGAKTIFKGTNSKEEKTKTTIGFQSSGSVKFTSVEVEDITLQIIKDGNDGAVLANIESTFRGGTLEGRDRRDGNSQVLSITNGNPQASSVENTGSSGTQAQGKITIEASDKGATTFQGAGIKIYGTAITIGKNGVSGAPLANGTTQATLILKTDGDDGQISLGKANTTSSRLVSPPAPTTHKDGEVLIDGSGTARTGEKQNLQLRSAQVGFDGSVTLKNLKIQTQSKNAGIYFMGKGASSTLSLEGIDLQVGMQDPKGDGKNEGRYQSLIFGSEEGQSKVKVSDAVTMKASDFSFSDQSVEIAKGKNLDLYAYGASKIGEAESVGLFHFEDTIISESNGSKQMQETGSSPSSSEATLKLYAKDTAKLLSNALTLKNIHLKTLQASSQTTASQGTESQAHLDLSDSSSDLTTLGKVEISAKSFVYGGTEGVGMNLFVGDSTGTGQLTLKSGDQVKRVENAQGVTPSFTIGGMLVLDSTANGQRQVEANTNQGSSFDIEMDSNKLSEHKISLKVTGGLSAIHKNAASQSTEVKAKSFDFDAGSKVHSRNGKLTLNSEDGQIMINGLTILEGTDTAKASIEATKKNGSSGGGGGRETTGSKLTLHDLHVRGSAELKEENSTKTFAFENSNLWIQGRGTDKTFTIQKSGSNGSAVVEGIANIKIDGATLDIKSSDNGAELKLNNGATITSRGVSEIKASGISAKGAVRAEGGTFALKVLDGTLTLQESTAKDAIGAVMLGQAGSKNGANLILLKTNGTQSPPPPPSNPTYNPLKIKAPLISYGNSSITAESFTAEGKLDLQVIDGTLELIAKGASAGLSIASGTISLDSGHLKYTAETTASQGSSYATPPASHTNGEIHILSKGDSSIQTKENGLSVSNTSIDAREGRLELIGLKEGSKFTNITVGNAGKLQAFSKPSTATENVNNLASLALTGKITLSADVSYVSPEAPLGKGSFGYIQAKAVKFDRDSTAGNKLIDVLVIRPQESLRGAALFALREGDITLIETTEGITKKAAQTPQTTEQQQTQKGEKITLDDVRVDAGTYRSLTLTPKLVESGAKDKVLQLLLSVQVSQMSLDQRVEAIEGSNARKEMETLLSQGINAQITQGILDGSNSYKAPFAELIAQGDYITLGNALGTISASYEAMSNLLELNDRFYDSVLSISFASLQGRMARFGNPHRAEEEIASLLSSISKYRYASTENGIFFDDATSPVDKGGLWLSYAGSMRSGSRENGSINGLTAGYDAILGDQALVGGFVSYLYGAYTQAQLDNRSHNLHLGLYSRLHFGAHELDFELSQLVGFDTANLSLNAFLAQDFTGEMAYKLYATNLQARYGYRFALGDEESPYYLKPFMGIEFSFLAQDGGSTTATQSFSINSREKFEFDLSAGLELRKYFDPSSYIFLIPMLRAAAYDYGSRAKVVLDGTRGISMDYRGQNRIDVGVYAGGEGQVAEHLLVTGSMGVKLGTRDLDLLTNWNVGLKYQF